jgi:Tol biopolymer transport system component
MNELVESTLEIYSLADASRRVVYRSESHFEAPNWSRDGASLLFNADGRLYVVPVTGGVPRLVDSGLAVRCNNDHGYSPDGRFIAISDETFGPSRIYVVPAGGGPPRLVTPEAPSFWHGWSPDGRTLAYCAGRGGGAYDIYTVPVEGGAEQRLTSSAALDDGPDYTPDGEWIYFNSARTGIMRIWRMRPDGSEQAQITFDEEYGDWFPHPSPDGRWLVFLSYDRSVQGHPPNQHVCLRRLALQGGTPEVLFRLFGGQGTINVPSWSPDSSAFAFVSYRVLGAR